MAKNGMTANQTYFEKNALFWVETELDLLS